MGKPKNAGLVAKQVHITVCNACPLTIGTCCDEGRVCGTQQHSTNNTVCCVQVQTRGHANSKASTCKVERVGGGYISHAGTKVATGVSDTVLASIGTVDVLPAEEPYSEYDFSIISEIVRLAEETAQQDYEAGRGSTEITLVRLLQAYEVVLPAHGVVPQEDVSYYRLLLELSLDSNPDWWAKIEQERNNSIRCAASAGPKTSRRKSNRGIAAAAAALPVAAGTAFAKAATVSGHGVGSEHPTNSHSISSAEPLQSTPPQTRRTAVLLPRSRQKVTTAEGLHAAGISPAVQAAAAAVDAATAAVAAALTEIQQTAAAGASHAGFRSLSPQQHQQLAIAADKWMSISHSLAFPENAWTAAELLRSCTIDLAQWSAPQSPAAVVGAGAGHTSISMQAHRQSTSPSPSSAPRAHSVSPARSCKMAAARSPHNARQRSRSASSPRRAARPSSSNSSGFQSLSSSPYGVHRRSSPYAVAAGAFQPPTAAWHTSSSFWSGAAALRAGSTNSIDAEHAAAGAAASRSASPWRADIAASYLLDLELEQYLRFNQRMSQCHKWQEHLLAAHAARDMQIAAEHRWRLAMSFWEVHCVWRCFKRWRQWAALSAEESSVSYRRWLMLCSFRWWMSMAKHYRRQRQAAEQQSQQSSASETELSVMGRSGQWPGGQLQSHRPSSPLTGISRLLQQQPHLRPPSTTAATLRQHPSGRLLVGCIFSAWQQLVQQRRELAHVQSLLAWHHIQHVQAGTWNKWRSLFERSCPHHKLMRVVYRSRRHSTLRRVVRHWRSWAPAKRAKRRKLRDVQAALTSSERQRIWQVLLEYTARRRASSKLKKQALQHYRRVCLHRHVLQWAHILDIKDACDNLADSFYDSLLTRKAAAALTGWNTWVQLRQEREQLQLDTCDHMEAFITSRCMDAWQRQVLRRQQLLELKQQGRYLSAKAAGRAALRAWHQRLQLRKRHQVIMLVIVSNVLRRQLSISWGVWRAYTLRKKQQQQDFAELSQVDTQRVWQQSFDVWCDALRRKVKAVQVADAILVNMLRRCVQRWKAWVDQKVDWRNFEAQCVQQMLRSRLATILQHWHAWAARSATVRGLLANFLYSRMQRQLGDCFSAWHRYLALRVAKRMNRLSALLHWEQGLLRKALAVWLRRTAVWKYKRMRRLRADSYRALRLLDLALTAWTSVWVESQELAQKATFFITGRQAELKVLLLRAWGEEAARLKLKRERMEIAGLHSSLTRQQQVLTAWQTEATRRIHLRDVLTSCLQRWSQSALSRAFEQWKSWALHRAALQRKAKAVMSLLSGRTLHWAFCMMSEHALRKRHTRSARHYYQQALARAVLGAWKQVMSDGKGFREVLLSVGQQMRTGLLAECFSGWQDFVRAKHWKAASMMRALLNWGGNRKKLCFQAWRQWAGLKQGKRESLHMALHHWQHLYLLQTFAAWKHYAQRMQVARSVMEHFHHKHLRAAFAAWQAWQQRKAYLAAVFAQLQGRGNQQLLQIVWGAWRAFVPSSQIKRQVKARVEIFWQKRLLAVCLFSWQDYVAVQTRKHQQLVSVLAHWQHRLLSSAFRTWRQVAQLQVYRRHVVDVMSGKLSNGLVFKTFSSWRDLVLAQQLRRERAADVTARWTHQVLSKVFNQWWQVSHEERFARKVQLQHQRRLLSATFSGWREQVLVQQQYNIIIEMGSNRWQQRLLWQAWAAWRELVDLHHQVAHRLHSVAQRWAHADLAKAWDAWRERVLLQQMANMAVARWRAGSVAKCFNTWRQWTARQRAAAHKVATARSRAQQQLIRSILQEWAELAWELPRERKAMAQQEVWLIHRALWGWHKWMRLRIRWRELDTAVAARWTNLHLTAAWRAWRGWVQQRQQKQQAIEAVGLHWRNLHLAAAFQAWWEFVQVTRHHKAVLETVAGRWRNLHTAAAFGAWRSFVKQQKARRAVKNAVAARWKNLHLATAFGAWHDAAVESAARVAAAEALARRLDLELLAAVCLSWQAAAAVRGKGRRLAGRWRTQQLRRGWAGWLEYVAWQQAKLEADQHWRRVVLSSMMSLWRRYTQRKAHHAKSVLLLLSRSEEQLLHRVFTSWREYTTYRLHKAAAEEYAASKQEQRVLAAWLALASDGKERTSAASCISARVQARTRQQLLQASMTGWRQYVTYRLRRSAADEYAISRLQQRAFSAWLLLFNQARYRESVAAHMAADAMARSHHLLVGSCFDAWQDWACEKKALKDIVLHFSTRRLRACLHAWQGYARRLSDASTLLRRLLASTLSGAFHEWRVIAAEQAHWRRVHSQLAEFILTDTGSVTLLARKAAIRWSTYQLSVAFTTWQANATEQIHGRINERRASTFLYFALTLKALTGFKWAVQDAKVDAAAGAHRDGVIKRSVFRAWRVAALYVKEKRHKVIAAVHTYASRLQRSGFIAWLLYLQHRHTKLQLWQQAARHYMLRRKAACLGAWLRVARYLAPLRRNLGHLHTKRQQQQMRQVLAAWQLQCHKSQLLQHVMARVMHKRLAVTFGAWREAAFIRSRRRSLFHSAITRLSHLQLSRAFNHWLEAAKQLQQLRAKAQLVLARTLQRQLSYAWGSWRSYVAYRSWKYALFAKAVAFCYSKYTACAMRVWKAFLEEAGHFRKLSERMLAIRKQKQLQAMLRWWHLIAQDLHHHRVVVASFRARRLREDGYAVLAVWQEWAHDRAQERKAIVVYWNRLLVTAFGAWLIAHEQAQTERAEDLHATHLAVRAIASWKLFMALMHRKRLLGAEAQQLQKNWTLKRGLQGWMMFTYYRHMGHVALHFRIRRLGCVVLREWQQAAQDCAQMRQLSMELTHQLAVNAATRLVTHWQQLSNAQRHFRRRRLSGCWDVWVYWAARHKVKSRVLRAAVQQLDAKKLERCFYCWRWYCQVRVMRNVAFQHKQRAIREALAIGEQVARRTRRALLASAFMAWHVQVSKYRKVAEKLASLLQHNLTTCFRAWRDTADHARVDLLRAERHAATVLLRKLLPAWLDIAQELRHQRQTGEAAADRFRRRHVAHLVLTGWREELQLLKEQRAGLWHVMMLLLQHEREALLQEALQGWLQQAQQQVALRACIASFVNKRRLECLSEFLTLWHQYTVAMHTDAGSLMPAGIAGSGTPYSSSKRSPRFRAASAAGSVLYSGDNSLAYYSVGPVLEGYSAGNTARRPVPAQLSSSAEPQSGLLHAAYEHAAIQSEVPAGLLPVTGGPGSPVLGPRSAHQDRRLARRLAAMGGGAAEVDPGSDDEQQLFASLPLTQAAAAAAERHDRQQPLLALSRGHKQRRVTLNDDKSHYNDAASGSRCASPGFDLHSIADSMRQAHEQGLSPWQLPSVRSPRSNSPQQTTLSLDELHSYQQQYPYQLQQQQAAAGGVRQGRHTPRHQRQLVHESYSLYPQQQQQYIGRTGSAGSCGDYQPLLQQQLMLHQQQVELCQQPIVGSLSQQHAQRDREWQRTQQQQQQHQHYEQAEPWHSSGQQQGHYNRHSPTKAANAHWSQKREHILGSYSANSSSSGTSGCSSSPSGVSAAAGSQDAAELQQLAVQEQQLHEHLYGRWANKGFHHHQQQQRHWDATGVRATFPKLPSYAGNALPRHLVALVSPTRVRRATSCSTGTAGTAVPVTPAGPVYGQRPSLGGVSVGSGASECLQQQQRGVIGQSSVGMGGVVAAEKSACGFSFGTWSFVGQL